MGITLADAIVNILPDDSALGPGFAKAQKEVTGWAGKISGAAVTAVKVGVAAVASLGVAAVAGGAKLIGMGSNAEEMLGKFNVVFANTGGGVINRLDAFAGAVGRSKFELMEMASTFGDTLKPMGFTEQSAADMSVQLTQLATDLGSFNNMPMDEALRRLQGTLIGSHENALAFGVIINENTLKAKMAEMGLDGLTGAAEEQAKVQARLALLMEGTTDAQGDAARTSGSWANQMRALWATLTDVGTEIGLKLLPVVTPLLQKFREFAKTVLPPLIETLSAKFIPILQKVSDAIVLMMSGDLRGGFEALFGQEITEKVIAGRDMIVGAIATIRKWWDENGDAIKEKALMVFSWYKDYLTWVFTNVRDFVVKAITVIREWWDENGDAIKEKALKVFGQVRDYVETVWPIIRDAVIEAITAIREWWDEHGEAIWAKTKEVFGQVRDFILMVVGKIQLFWDEHGAAILATIQRTWDALVAIFQGAWSVLEDIFNVFKALFEGDWEEFGYQLVKLFADAWKLMFLPITTTWDIIKPWVDKLFNNVGDSFSSGKFLEIGGNIVRGIADGIRGAARYVQEALSGVVNDAIDSIKRRLGIHSPSAVMASLIGAPMAAGVGVGFQNQMRLETAGLSGSLMGAVSNIGGMTYAPAVSIDARGSGMNENGLRRMVQDELKRGGREADMLRRSGR